MEIRRSGESVSCNRHRIRIDLTFSFVLDLLDMHLEV